MIAQARGGEEGQVAGAREEGREQEGRPALAERRDEALDQLLAAGFEGGADQGGEEGVGAPGFAGSL